jgi:shikimate 5-dehydrogenase
MLVYQGILAMELFLDKKIDKKEAANIYFEILR